MSDQEKKNTTNDFPRYTLEDYQAHCHFRQVKAAEEQAKIYKRNWEAAKAIAEKALTKLDQNPLVTSVTVPAWSAGAQCPDRHEVMKILAENGYVTSRVDVDPNNNDSDYPDYVITINFGVQPTK